MELLLNLLEQDLIYNKFGININGFVDTFIVFEKIEKLVKEKEKNLNLIANLRPVNAKTNIIRFFKQIEITEKYYEYRSLVYYSRLEENTFRELYRSGNNESYNKYEDTIRKFLCSIYNMLMVLNEECLLENRNDAKKILVFEACPSDSKRIHTREEALIIKNTLEKYKYVYMPIIRFGTNSNVFKQVCNQNKIFILHIASHGNREGIVLMGESGPSSTYSSKSFCEFFDDDYKYKPIELCFINSCFSSLITQKTIANNSFNHSIGYEGENDDNYAVEFSREFYDRLHSHSNVKTTFESVEDYFSKPFDKLRYFSRVLFL